MMGWLSVALWPSIDLELQFVCCLSLGMVPPREEALHFFAEGLALTFLSLRSLPCP